MQIAYAHAVQLANAERAAEREAATATPARPRTSRQVAAQAEPADEPQEPERAGR